MRSRSFFVILLGVVLALLSIGFGGFYQLVLRDPAARLQRGLEPVPAAMMFMPRQAPFILSLQANPEVLEAYEYIGLTPEQRRSRHQAFAQFKRNLLAGTGLRYTSDIRPWVGDEITFAITSEDLDRDPTNGRQPGYLAALSIQDDAQAQAFLQRFWEKRELAGQTVQHQTYAGVKILADETLAMAQFGDRFMLMANAPKVLRQAINVVQVPEYGLKRDDSVMAAFKTEAQSTTGDRIGVLYAQSEAIQWVIDPDAVSDQATASTPRNANPVVATLALTEQGIRLAGTEVGAVPTLTPSGQSGSRTDALEDVLRYVPSRSAIALVGANVNQLLEQAEEFPQRLVSSKLAPWRDRWQDLFFGESGAQISGHYALATLSTAPQPAWIFVSHPAAAEEETEGAIAQWIEALNAAGTQQGLNVVTFPLREHTVTAWTRIDSNVVPLPARGAVSAVTEDVIFDAEVEGVYTTVDGTFLFAPTPEALNAALSAASNGEALANAEPQIMTNPAFLSAQSAYLYANGQSLWATLDTQPGTQHLWARTQPFSNTMEFLVLSRDRPDHDVGFIQLQGA
jgi:hypothetical protein